MAPDMPIGERIKAYRVRRRLTQAVLAERVGRSTSWLEKVERGVRGVESWRLILDLADVLRCDPRDLAGRRLNLAPDGGTTLRSLAELRSVLTGYDWLLAAVEGSAGVGETGRSGIGTMQQQVDDANRQYQAAHYEEAARLMAQLIREAERTKRELASGDDDRPIH